MVDGFLGLGNPFKITPKYPSGLPSYKNHGLHHGRPFGFTGSIPTATFLFFIH